MRKNPILLIFSFLFFQTNHSIFSQSKYEIYTFEDAEFFYAAEAYRDALSLYLQLYKGKYKNNPIVLYKIGICYLSLPGEKNKAIEFLEKASEKANSKFKRYSLTEPFAPIDTWLYLGNAYRIDLKLDKAIEAYNQFLKLSPPNKNNEINIIWAEKQIEACNRAREAIKKPLEITITPFGKPLGNKNNEINPVITHKEDLMIYCIQQKFTNIIYKIEKKNNKWNTPQTLNSMVMSDGNLFPVCISNDGKTLLLNYVDLDKSNIYQSQWNGKRFTPAIPFKEINSKYGESHACISSDNKIIYFTSNRPTSKGGLDIFYIEKITENTWSIPKNIGGPINTEFNEETPFLSITGDTLYFSSQGHSSIGGFDIFYSIRQSNETWSEPFNLGYPVNTTDDDLFYVPINAHSGYQSRYSKETKSLQIVKITINTVLEKDQPYEK